MASSARGMVAVSSPRSSRREAADELSQSVHIPAISGENAHILQTRGELLVYFGGRGRAQLDSIPLDADVGSPFERQVWALLRRIPYGRTRSYGELARMLGRPRAARAVGRCNAKNPWAIVVPCHRVLGSDSSLTGYSGGLTMKRRLLELEGVDLTALRAKVLAAVPRRKRGHAGRN